MSKTTFFTPGPSQLNPNLAIYLKEALNNNILSISHRSQEFKDLYQETEANLIKLLNAPKNYKMLTVGSATEAMERITLSCASKNTSHYICGAFGQKWQKIAFGLGKNTKIYNLNQNTWQFDAESGLNDIPELTCFTHNETSNGILLPNKILEKLARSAKKKKSLVAVDIVSSAPFISFDWALIDYALFSVQKAFGLPAGLGVIIANPNNIDLSQNVIKKTKHDSYASINQLLNYATKYQTPATPNVLNIYLLNKVTKDYLLNKNLTKDNLKRANKLYKIINNNKILSVAVTNNDWQSKTVIVANVNDGNKNLIISAKKQGLIIGTGYKDHKEKQIRIANFIAPPEQAFNKLCNFLIDY